METTEARRQAGVSIMNPLSTTKRSARIANKATQKKPPPPADNKNDGEERLRASTRPRVAKRPPRSSAADGKHVDAAEAGKGHGGSADAACSPAIKKVVTPTTPQPVAAAHAKKTKRRTMKKTTTAVKKKKSVASTTKCAFDPLKDERLGRLVLLQLEHTTNPNSPQWIRGEWGRRRVGKMV